MSLVDKLTKGSDNDNGREPTVGIGITIMKGGKAMPAELSFKLDDKRQFVKLGPEGKPVWPLLGADKEWGKSAKAVFDTAQRRSVIVPMDRESILELIEAYNLVDPDHKIEIG